MSVLFTRRDFIKTTGLGIAALTVGCSSKKNINKREAILSLLNENKKQEYIPAGFFIHFGDGYQWNDAAVNRHLEYFKAIDMDFIKVQYEQVFPVLANIKKPSDWKNMPLYKKDFYEKQLYIVKELIKSKKEAPIIVTLYSPFMCAGHTSSDKMITEHLKIDPENVKKGMDIITESVMIFAKECIKLGADGFLACTQGGESFRFEDKSIFQSYVKPYDLEIMSEINKSCNCNILHICDYHGDYDDLTPFLDYPGQAVNCCLDIAGERKNPTFVYNMFKRPFMGGIEKNGIIVNGSKQQIKDEVTKVASKAPEKFILGASCTLPGNINWNNIKVAINTAHHYEV